MNRNCPPLDDHASKTMKSNKGRNTRPELIVRSALRDAGYPGYRLEWKVPGKPDISYPGRKIAIFVNGCFWHRCPLCKPNVPKHNHEFWVSKFKDNVERDQRNYRALEEMGWTVVVIWECEIKKDMNRVTRKLIDVIESKSETGHS